MNIFAKERFWQKVKTGEGCWEWTAYRKRGGYGQFWDGKIHVLSHRFVYELTFGPIPETLCVCHTCDNPGCVNPAHLFLGTHKENMQDMYNKNRQRGASGEKHHRAILKATDIPVIRLRQKIGETAGKIARDYGVARVTIQHIIDGRTWRHIV